ncbi:alpha/beta hydrolase [Membranihabitans maritimus]|uniref:alpha/beta hydrolase n=1 Tax=Membranihabitans maritimus TaxID=2904244 RepID=UPI001F227454|nr:alpha/beta hydrolase [Membranihabitans maritimus]
MRELNSFLILFLSSIFISNAQDLQRNYKMIDTIVLSMNIYLPNDFENGDSYPGMVFFFGGGWKVGSTKQFHPHAEYFSSRGIVCFVADYRMKSRHGTTPFESLKDAKSAIRYIRKNANEYKVDSNRIIASGGSAGGHLAAATALIENYNEKGEDLSVSCTPNALVLFNPVIDNGPGGNGFDRIGEFYKNFSPLHNVRKGAPPTIVFFGMNDKLIPVETMKYFKTIMERVGSRCDLFLYKNESHGFFNYTHQMNYLDTVKEMDKFLGSLGYLVGAPTIEME